MTRRQVVRLTVLFLVVFIIAPSLVLAQGNILPGQIVPQQCNDPGGCKSICDLAQVAQNILNTGIYIAVFLSAILFAWAGFLYLTNSANSSGISKAKEVFFNVAVGLVIILVGWLVIDTVMKVLAGGKFGTWNKVCELLLQHVSAFV